MLSSLGLVAKMPKESLQVVLGKVVVEVYEIHLAKSFVRLGARWGIDGSHHWFWLEEKRGILSCRDVDSVLKWSCGSKDEQNFDTIFQGLG